MPAVMGSNIPDQGVTSRMLNLTALIASVATSETTTSTSFTDLATGGPAVTPTPGVTQNHLISVSCFTYNNTAGTGRNRMSPAIAGETAVIANAYGQTGTDETVGSAVHLATSQVSGAVHTSKYKVDAGTGTFSSRKIIGIAV